MGKWLDIYGPSIYNTKGGYIKPQEWGAITQNGNKMFVHILKKDAGTISLENVPFKKVTKAYLLKDGTDIKTALQKGTLTFAAPAVTDEEPDQVIVLETKS